VGGGKEEMSMLCLQETDVVTTGDWRRRSYCHNRSTTADNTNDIKLHSNPYFTFGLVAIISVGYLAKLMLSK
jgi:hypothetical protein